MFILTVFFLFCSSLLFLQSASWRWPFFALLAIVLGMVALSAVKYKQLKKQHLL